MKIPCHLCGEGKVTSVEAFNLVDRGSCVLGKIEDIDLTFAEDNPHTDGGVAE